MVGDPIGDMINRIKNAGMAGNDTVSVPYSKLKFEILNILKNEGYIKSVEVIGKDKGANSKALEIGISYVERPALSSELKRAKINGAERVSKPSKRIYIKSGEIFPLLKKKGIYVISTTSGIMSLKGAEEKNLGGEILFRIW